MEWDLSCKMFSCTFPVQVVLYGYVGFCFAMIFFGFSSFFPSGVLHQMPVFYAGTISLAHACMTLPDHC